VPNLDSCTNADKKDAYGYLDLKVGATVEGANIKGYLDPSVLTTEQTSGCMCIGAYGEYSPQTRAFQAIAG
jgi:site-specific DNA recombinase